MDKIYKISPGLTIGRKKSDLNLDDPKVSSFHASIQENAGQFFLVDHDSRNGVLMNGQRIKSIALKAGITVQIGQTSIAVINLADDHPELNDPLETWQSILAGWNKQLENVKFQPTPVGPLDPAVQLTFIQGRQLHTTWTMGYGPRKIGFLSMEFPIHEPGAPETCLEIYPNAGPWFKTEFPQQVRLNNEPVACEQLKDGDKIHIGESILQVEFIKTND